MLSVADVRPSLLVATVLALGGCATIPPGHAGVLTTATGGVQPTPLGEGIHVRPPFARVDIYNLRAQERTDDLVAISADGAPVIARASLVTYSLVPDELAALEREIGPDFFDVVIQPIVQATVRRVLARYRAFELDTPTIRRAQDEITKLAAERIRPFHIRVDSVDLRTLQLEMSPRVYRSVLDVGILEQQIQAVPQHLELERRRAEARREEARAIAAAHALVAPTLSRAVLDDDARRAEEQLLTSPSTRVIVDSPKQPMTLEVDP